MYGITEEDVSRTEIYLIPENDYPSFRNLLIADNEANWDLYPTYPGICETNTSEISSFETKHKTENRNFVTLNNNDFYDC